MAPAAEYVPLGQERGFEDGKGQKNPSGQVKHAETPEGEYVPSAHNIIVLKVCDGH